jgi:hypothetical protein
MIRLTRFCEERALALDFLVPPVILPEGRTVVTTAFFRFLWGWPLGVVSLTERGI